MRPKSLLALFVALCSSVSACATTIYAGPHANQDQVGDAMQQPFRDISWMREDPPEILKHAVLEPYRLAEEIQCEEIMSEIIALDLLLGPDVDEYEVDEQSGGDAFGLAADAVASFIGLPFRGVLRWVSGADEREKVLADAILSGVARRSFLKGAARGSRCAQPDPEPELR